MRKVLDIEPVITRKEFEEIKNKLKEMENIIHGNGRGKMSLSSTIVNEIYKKCGIELLYNRQTSLIVIGAILILLIIANITLMCIFQSQLADVSDFMGVL